ncbi:MAG: hypothetical protein K0R09_3297, partial [Clostridiales bacterium]|nr:hypothetical protein [Clostridiales bacterium]
VSIGTWVVFRVASSEIRFVNQIYDEAVTKGVNSF